MSNFDNIGDDMEYAPETPMDGQEYHPAPLIVPDTREGFDESGDYHAVPKYPQPELPEPDYGAILASMHREKQYREALERQSRLHKMTMHIIQTCLERPQYQPDLDFDVLYTAQEIHEENGLGEFTPEEVFDEYFRVWGE